MLDKSRETAAQRPLLGVKRTWRGRWTMSANDPKRTINELIPCRPVQLMLETSEHFAADAAYSKRAIYFRVQASSSHTEMHSQSHVGAPIIGNSTPHRRHPFVMTWLAAGLLKQEIAPYPDEGE